MCSNNLRTILTVISNKHPYWPEERVLAMAMRVLQEQIKSATK